MQNKVPWSLLVSSLIVGVIVWLFQGLLISLFVVSVYALASIVTTVFTKTWFDGRRWTVALTIMLALLIIRDIGHITLYLTIPGLVLLATASGAVFSLLGGENLQIPG